MKTIAIIAGVAVALVGGVGVVFFGDQLQAKPSPEAQQIAAAHEFVRASLKDPESAQFTDDVTGPGVVCGKVNAKNSFGGYVGPRQYVASVQGVTTSYATAAVYREDDPIRYDTLATTCPGHVGLTDEDKAFLRKRGD